MAEVPEELDKIPNDGPPFIMRYGGCHVQEETDKMLGDGPPLYDKVWRRCKRKQIRCPVMVLPFMTKYGGGARENR